MLFGFAFELSYSLFVGEELAPPVAPNLSIPTTLAKPPPSRRSALNLPALEKVELLLLGLTEPTMVLIVIAQKSFS